MSFAASLPALLERELAAPTSPTSAVELARTVAAHAKAHAAAVDDCLAAAGALEHVIDGGLAESLAVLCALRDGLTHLHAPPDGDASQSSRNLRPCFWKP